MIGKRANSNEPIFQAPWHETHEPENKTKSNVTLKPNEVVLPRVDPRENRNFVTKHHLDDTET